MKKTSRKKIVSIIGMISIRAFLTVLRESRIKSFHSKCLTSARNFLPPRRKVRKENPRFSELGVLCVFAGVTSFPILQANIHLRISKYLRLVFPFLLSEQQLQARAVVLDLFQFPFGAVGKIVVRDERENGDQEACGGGDQGLGHAAGDRMRLSEAGLRHDTEGTDHAGDGS